MCEVLLIGSESAGKSSLIKRIREISSVQSNDSNSVLGEIITATVGVDIVDVHYFSKEFKIRELGSAISSRWHTYYNDSGAMIFVIDSSDPASWPQAYVMLHESLSYGSCWKEKEILIVLNKTDMVDHLTFNACKNMLGLDDLAENNRRISIKQGCSLVGSSEGKALAKEVLDWAMMSLRL